MSDHAGDPPDPDPDPVPAWELIDADAVWVELHPRPLWARRLVGHPNSQWLVADRDGMAVPAWLIEGRPRSIDKLDVVVLAWPDIERFRVRADDRGPDVYDITCRVPGGGTRQWRVRRGEIHDELPLLDHARRVGRVTIVLEDTIKTR